MSPKRAGASGGRGRWYEREVNRKIWEPSDAERLRARNAFRPGTMTAAERAAMERSFGRMSPAEREAQRRAGQQAINPNRRYDNQFTNNFHANTGLGGPRYDQSIGWNSLSLSEQQQVEAAWTAMKRNDGLNYWEVNTYFTPDGIEHRDLKPKAMSMWNIENDGEKWGWNDIMIGELQTRLTESIPKAAGFEEADGYDIYADPRGGGGGGGGGGPVYVEPMRSVIEDTVKAMLTSLTGDEPDKRVQELTDIYLKADKARWKVGLSGGVDIVPNQVVLESIREQDDYKRIHKLRAESDSETGWIASKNQRLQQLGVGSQDADERAVFLAQTGTNLNDIDTGALQITRGMKDITLMGKIKKAASSVARQL